LNLQPANASFGGVVTTGAQTFAGTKTFNGNVITNGNVTAVGNVVTNGNVIISNPPVIPIGSTGATLTAANILTGYILSFALAFPTASITLPTVASIASALGSANKGTSFEFSVENISPENLTLTLGAGMGVQSSPVIAGSNSLVITNGARMGHFRLVFTSATTAMLFRIY
jgi:hypothetical protein